MGILLLERAFGERIFINGKSFEFKPYLKTAAWVAGRTVRAGFRYFPEVLATRLIQWSSEGPKELCVGPIYFWKCWHRLY